MGNLSKRIERIVKKYHLDAVYGRNGRYYTFDELLHNIGTRLPLWLKDYNFNGVVIYPGGKLGKLIAESLLESDYIVTAIIDNNTNECKYKGIPILKYNEYLNSCSNEMILIASVNQKESFINEIIWDGFSDRYLDVWEWLCEEYHNIDMLLRDEGNIWDLNNVNEKILLYESSGNLTTRLYHLKAIIYELVNLRDFCYAESWIEKLRVYMPVYIEYSKAMSEMRDELYAITRGRTRNVFVVHIIDCLETGLIDSVPWLREYSRRYIRLDNVVSQYTFTEYCVNTMFTGKDAFDIETNGRVVEWNDSALLKYIRDNARFSLVSANDDINDEYKNINSIDSRERIREELTDVLFRGLELIEETPDNHFIVLHSWGEVHVPFRSVGKPYREPSGLKKRYQFYDQFAKALEYLNDELSWYGNYYDVPGIINMYVGDHGISPEAVVSFNIGIKPDIPFLNSFLTNPACIIGGEGLDQLRSDYLIPQKRIGEIVLDIFQKQKTDINDYITDSVDLQQLPYYSSGIEERFAKVKAYSQYEGAFGIRTTNEIFVITASGREMYFRPFEYAYRNLVDNNSYKEQVEAIRNKLITKCVPKEIYKMDRYKHHIAFLKRNDPYAYNNTAGIDRTEEEPK